jgi:hypothetical protein
MNFKSFFVTLLAISATWTSFTMKKNDMDILFKIGANGTVDDVKHFLAEGGDINYHDEHNATLFNWACGGNNIEVVKFLLSKDCDITRKDKWGRDALTFAYGKEMKELVAAELEKRQKKKEVKEEDQKVLNGGVDK